MPRELDLDMTGMFFTRNWFRTRNLATFRQYVWPEFSDKPTLYLELGCFEGMSMCWMLQRVLTHPDSRAVGVDPWLQTTKLGPGEMEQVMQRALANTSQWMLCEPAKVQLHRANSAELLRRMTNRHGFSGIKKNTVDVCMVDGNHNALAVLDDLRLVYQLVKPGGWILLDDVENDHEKQDHVKQGLDMWKAEETAYRQLWKHRYMECYQKL